MYFMCILLHFYPRIRAFRLPPPVTPVPPRKATRACFVTFVPMSNHAHGIMRERAPGGNAVVSGWFSFEDSVD